MHVARTFKIETKDGIIDLDASQELLNRVAVAYHLDSTDSVSDSHVKNFLTYSLSKTLEEEDV